MPVCTNERTPPKPRRSHRPRELRLLRERQQHRQCACGVEASYMNLVEPKPATTARGRGPLTKGKERRAQTDAWEPAYWCDPIEGYLSGQQRQPMAPRRATTSSWTSYLECAGRTGSPQSQRLMSALAQASIERGPQQRVRADEIGPELAIGHRQQRPS